MLQGAYGWGKLKEAHAHLVIALTRKQQAVGLGPSSVNTGKIAHYKQEKIYNSSRCERAQLIPTLAAGANTQVTNKTAIITMIQRVKKQELRPTPC
jgi:hypothetical protein